MPGKIDTLSAEITAYVDRNDFSLPEGFLPSFLEHLTTSLTSLKTALDNNNKNHALHAYIAINSLEDYLRSAKIKQFLQEEGNERIAMHISRCISQAFEQAAADPHSRAFIPMVDAYTAAHVSDWTTKFIEYVKKQDHINLEDVFQKLTNMITISLLNGVRINCNYDIYTAFAAALQNNLKNLTPYIDVEADISAISRLISLCLPMQCKFHNSDNPLQSINPIDVLTTIQNRAKLHITNHFEAATIAEILTSSIDKHAKHQQGIRDMISYGQINTSYQILSSNYLALNQVKKNIAQQCTQLSQQWLAGSLQRLGLIWAFEPVKAHKGGELLAEMAKMMADRILEQVMPYYTLPPQLFEAPQTKPKRPQIA